MYSSSTQSPFIQKHCLGAMRTKVPRLREAMARSDEATVRGLARELRDTLGLLGLPRLYQLSQDIEYRRADVDPTVWDSQCHRFCDLLERIHLSLQQQHARN